MALVLPDPCPGRYDVVEKSVEVNLTDVVVGKEELSGLTTEFGQEIWEVDQRFVAVWFSG